jgi:GMP synthase-like glutamine amidotransferase
MSITDLRYTSYYGITQILQEMHQDHVPAVPPNCHLLASTSISPNQGYVRFTSNSDVPPPSSQEIDPSSIQILTVQGHPEFTQGIIDKLVVARTEKGILTQEMKEDVEKRSKMRNDGVVVGKAIWRILGIDA